MRGGPPNQNFWRAMAYPAVPPSPEQAVHTHVSVTKQYNLVLVLVEGR